MSEIGGRNHPATPSTALLLDAHRLDALVFHQFRLFAEALEPEVAVYLVLHLPQGSHLHEDRVLVLTDADIFPAGRLSKVDAKTILPGNPDLKLVRAVQTLPRYDAYLRIESDVVCSTPIRETFLRLLTKCAGFDFVAKEITNKHHLPDWMWWDTFKGPPDIIEVIDANRIWKAFLPMLYFSSEFIEGYAAALETGWDGHYEVTMPTFAKFANLKFGDFRRIWPTVSHHATFDVHRLVKPKPNGYEFHHPVKCLEDLIELVGFHEIIKPSS